jgi:hypothetical protein
MVRFLRFLLLCGSPTVADVVLFVRIRVLLGVEDLSAVGLLVETSYFRLFHQDVRAGFLQD